MCYTVSVQIYVMQKEWDEKMTGAERRKKILELMRNASEPLSGTMLARETGVSRQVVVQDIALLRTEGYTIIATTKGYMLEKADRNIRLFKVYHGNERTEEELNVIVDMGGAVLDVMVNHRVYGKMSAQLGIRSRRDVQKFMESLKTGKSIPLLNITSGYHFHHVYAEQEEILDEIEEMLREKGFLCEIFPYEQELEER